MYWLVVRTGNGHKELIIQNRDGVDLPSDIPYRSLHHAIHAAKHAFSERLASVGTFSLQKGTYYGYYLRWRHDAHDCDLRATWFIVPIHAWNEAA
jgi:hypothetical protein